MTTWTYKGADFTDDDIGGKVGFVYLITNLKTKRKYVGKKLFYFSRKKKVKGRVRRVQVISDWKEYYGSSEHLQADLAELGEKKFKREILHLCDSKGVMSYLEIKEQIEREVLLTDEYYNGIINCKIHARHLSKLG